MMDTTARETHYRTLIETLIGFLKMTTTDAIAANALLETIGLTQHQRVQYTAKKAEVASTVAMTFDQLQNALLKDEPERIAKALHDWFATANQLALGLKNTYEA